MPPPLSRPVRWLAWSAVGLLLLGSLDPIEGSVAIAVGAVLAASAAAVAHSRERRLLLFAAILTIVGVGTMYAMSAAGGIGGHTGRSSWWALLLIPYPTGWVMALMGAFRVIGRSPNEQ